MICIKYFMALLLISSFLIMMNPVVASAKYKDWSTAKQAGHVVEFIDGCQQFVGIFMHDDIIGQISKIRKHYRGNTQFQDGVHGAYISNADVCSNCAEVCMKYKDSYIRALNQHFSRISVTKTRKHINNKLKNIERKCTELGFTKGTEKHGDCVIKMYK